MQTQCLASSPSSLSLAAEVLSRAELVALPTETVYGLAADATSEDAVKRIYAAKGRPALNPLIVHVDRTCTSLTELARRGYINVEACSRLQRQTAQRLMDAFWPGPLTVILPRGEALAASVTAGGDTVGLRMPQHPVFLDLLQHLDFPLAAPSANRSNRISPSTASAVLQELGGQIPLILDAGPTRVGVESTVVTINSDGSVRLLRPGGTPAEAIQELLSCELGAAKSQDAVLSPGMGTVHYAPKRPLLLCDTEIPWHTRVPGGQHLAKHVAVLLFSTRELPRAWRAIGTGQIEVYPLEDLADGSVAATRLYSTLRDIDNSKAELIVVEKPRASHGLWPALLDRLGRAACNAHLAEGGLV